MAKQLRDFVECSTQRLQPTQIRLLRKTLREQGPLADVEEMPGLKVSVSGRDCSTSKSEGAPIHMQNRSSYDFPNVSTSLQGSGLGSSQKLDLAQIAAAGKRIIQQWPGYGPRVLRAISIPALVRIVYQSKLQCQVKLA